MAMIAARPRGALCCALLAALTCAASAAVEFEEAPGRASAGPAANANPNAELEAALRKAADLEAEAMQLIANVSAIAARRFRHRGGNATVAMRRNASHADADDEEDDLPMLNANISLTMTRKAGAEQDRKQQQRMSEGTAYLRASLLPPDLRF